MDNRKVVLYISMSLDGYLATKDDDLSWLDKFQIEGEDYGYGAVYKEVDTYIIGRLTYDKILSLTGGKLPQAASYKCYVITRQSKNSENGVEFYNGQIDTLIKSLKAEKGKNIVCDGGGQVVKLLMEKNLIDEYIISIIPIILGDGKRLFVGGTPLIDLELLGVKSFDSGLSQLHYLRK